MAVDRGSLSSLQIEEMKLLKVTDDSTVTRNGIVESSDEEVTVAIDGELARNSVSENENNLIEIDKIPTSSRENGEKISKKQLPTTKDCLPCSKNPRTKVTKK